MGATARCGCVLLLSCVCTLNVGATRVYAMADGAAPAEIVRSTTLKFFGPQKFALNATGIHSSPPGGNRTRPWRGVRS